MVKNWQVLPFVLPFFSAFGSNQVYAGNFEAQIDDATLTKLAQTIKISGKGMYLSQCYKDRSDISLQPNLQKYCKPKPGKFEWNWKVVSPKITLNASGAKVGGVLQAENGATKFSKYFNAPIDILVSQDNTKVVLRMQNTKILVSSADILPRLAVSIELRNVLSITVPMQITSSGIASGSQISVSFSNLVAAPEEGKISISGDIQIQRNL
jgi:hypothetical protein